MMARILMAYFLFHVNICSILLFSNEGYCAGWDSIISVSDSCKETPGADCPNGGVLTNCISSANGNDIAFIKRVDTVGFSNIFIYFSLQLDHSHCHAFYRVSNTTAWMEFNTEATDDDENTRRWRYLFDFNSTLSNNANLELKFDSTPSSSVDHMYCYWDSIYVSGNPLKSRPDIESALNQLTLSPTQRSDAEANSSQSNDMNTILNVLWFGFGYLMIGLFAIVMQFCKAQNTGLSCILFMFVLQGALDILDVTSDAFVANELLSGSGNKCGWTQCDFPDIFESYGTALLVCVIISSVITFITIVICLVDIINKIKFPDLDDTDVNPVVARLDFALIVIKMFCCDFAAIIIYLSLWNVSYKSAGIQVSNITVVSFILTCIDIIYALCMICLRMNRTNKFDEIYICSSVECCDSCVLRMMKCCACAIFVTVCVGVGFLISFSKTGDYPSLRLSIGETCYYPKIFGDDHADTNEGEIEFWDIVLLNVSINESVLQHEFEYFTMRINYLDGSLNPDDGVTSLIGFESMTYHDCNVTHFSSFTRYSGSNDDWLLLTGKGFQYGCYQTIWNCEVAYMKDVPIEICLDECKWQ